MATSEETGVDENLEDEQLTAAFEHIQRSELLLADAKIEADQPFTILLIGVVGAGKSSMANTLLGHKPYGEKPLFEVSGDGSSVTRDTKSVMGNFFGMAGRPLRIVDTPGHGDRQGRDADFRKQMILELKKVRTVHAIMWIINAEKPRIDQQDDEFFDILSKAFGPGFLKNLLVNFSFFGHAKSSYRKRSLQGKDLSVLRGNVLQFIAEFTEKQETKYEKKNDKQPSAMSEEKKTEKKKHKALLQALNGILRAETIRDGRRLRYFTIDALYDDGNPDELAKFEEERELLWKTLQSLSAYPVTDIEFIESRLESAKKKRIMEEKKRQEAELKAKTAREEMERDKKRAEAELEKQKAEFEKQRQIELTKKQELEEKARQALEDLEKERIRTEEEAKQAQERFQQEQREMEERFQHASEKERQQLQCLMDENSAKMAEEQQKLREQMEKSEAERQQLEEQNRRDAFERQQQAERDEKRRQEELDQFVRIQEQQQEQTRIFMENQERAMLEARDNAQRAQEQTNQLLAQMASQQGRGGGKGDCAIL